ncbi:MAG: cobyrinate a,c-diamide synthase [Nitratireductor sp.]|nr:cobyrinate a,c-diamide synthase [Nitratireductor sp.]
MPPENAANPQYGLMLAAPSSGSGKTVLTLALLRALRNAGIEISGAKAGPDFIDPAYHEVSAARASANLDPWAMTAARLQHLAGRQQGTHLLVEAMMGLFDGAADGTGSAADLALSLGLPVVLVVDAAKQSHSVAALVRGFRDHRPGLDFAGVMLNKVGSPRHEAMLRDALSAIEVRVFGAVPRAGELFLPERHLGLVQAGEHEAIDAFIDGAASVVERSCDIAALAGAFAPLSRSTAAREQAVLPLGQRIAIARDPAFAFIYPHMLDDWREAGAELAFFSPLADEAPPGDCDAVYLPGGYPELHGGRLASAERFRSGMADAARRGICIYGECGGYMVMGEGIEDEDGVRHAMLGLLPLETSFVRRKLHLGYRRLEALSDFAMGRKLMAHEFHYTSPTREEGNSLFSARDALGAELGKTGLRNGNVMGSYMHVIGPSAAEDTA